MRAKICTVIAPRQFAIDRRLDNDVQDRLYVVASAETAASADVHRLIQEVA